MFPIARQSQSFSRRTVERGRMKQASNEEAPTAESDRYMSIRALAEYSGLSVRRLRDYSLTLRRQSRTIESVARS
jgi:hypothetical protein